MGNKLKKNVPVLRFPEFEGDWQSQKLKNILIESNVLASEELPLYSLTIESGIVPKTERYERSFLVKNEEEAYKVVQPNDFAYNPMNLRFGALARHTESKLVKVSKYYNIFSVNPKANVIFVDYLLTKSSSIRFYDSIAMGSLVEKKRVHFSDFLNSKFLLPSIAEQEKIASLLGAIDRRLTQLRRKRKLLQTYKRGVMQKIFSQKIRFKQDDGSPFPNWEKKKLGQLLTIRYGKDHKDLEDGNYPVLGTGGIMRYVNSYLYDKPSILIGRKGTIDKPQFITYPFWTVDTLFYSEINPDMIPFFLFLVVQSINWQKYNEATGVPSLNTSSINNVKVIIPYNKKEQEKIANFLTAIDHKIETLTRQIEQTEQFKKGLLQKLFV